MDAFWILLIVVAGAVLLLLIYPIAVYNRLVSLRERFKNAYSQIDVQLKRRYDLIPNLVETVKGYMTHERETLEAVIAARNVAASANVSASAHPDDPSAIRKVAAAESQLTGALGRLMMVQERYPDLKANDQAGRLIEELSSTENRIAFARQHYNDSVMTYNSYRQSFPPVLIANPAGFADAELFEISDPGQREAVQVQFDQQASSAKESKPLT